MAFLGSCSSRTRTRPGTRPSRTATRSPAALAFSPDGRTLAVSDATAGSLVLFALPSGARVAETALRGRPAGVAWSPDGSRIYVAESRDGTVAELDAAGRLIRRLAAGPWPTGLAFAGREGLLLATDVATDSVSVIDVAGGRERSRVPVVREPFMLAMSPDERLAVVGNRLPAGDATDPAATACVTLLDPARAAGLADIPLPPNSMNVHGVAVSPDGAWAYAVHSIGRTTLATQQLERGHVMAYALSIVDVPKRRLHATVLLDQRWAGSANPWGAAVAADGRSLWIALAGTHQLVRVNLLRLHAALAPFEWRLAHWRATYLDRGRDDFGSDLAPSTSSDALGDDPATVELVLHTLPAAAGQGVFLADMSWRIDLPGKGPRAVALSPDGRWAAVALTYSGTVALVDTRTNSVSRVVSLGPQPEPDQARRGEILFHDALRSYQEWLSCSTCHPEGRADGLNWDLLNDGIGNPKNTRSLVWSHRTPPAMARGVRPSMDAAVTAGFRFLLFQTPQPDELEAVRAYLRSLKPEPSPFLVGGRLSDKARRGKALFHSAAVGCARCHPPPRFTDLRMHDVGTRVDSDLADEFDTPSLVEVWRTAPYLHHGRARTLRQVLSWYNASDWHGHTAHLTDEALDALVAYLKSL